MTPSAFERRALMSRTVEALSGAPDVVSNADERKVDEEFVGAFRALPRARRRPRALDVHLCRVDVDSVDAALVQTTSAPRRTACSVRDERPRSQPFSQPPRGSE
jgi:hypothetical protein